MGSFFSASLMHQFSRFDSGDSDTRSMPSDNQSMLDLIAKISKDHNGAAYERAGNQVIYAFDEVELAAQAAISLQTELDLLNASNHLSPIYLASTGIVSLINPFTGFQEERESIQLVSFMAESAGAGALYLSEGAYNALKNPDILLCRFTRQLLRTGDDRVLNAYEVFWNPAEVDLRKFRKDPDVIELENQPIRSFGLKLVAGILLLFFGVLLLTEGYKALWAWFIHLVNR
jgi:hypothetical protein